jgi:hypothetical protein
VGLDHKENRFGGFFIASPEKALADLVFQTSQKMTEKELFVDLTESRRIEITTLKTLDKTLMKQISSAYRSKAIKTLADVIDSV